MVVFGKHSHIEVVSSLKFCRDGRMQGRFVPTPKSGGQMSLHMVRVRNTRRRLDIFIGEFPAQRGPLDALVKMNQLVVGSRVQRIHSQKRMIKRRPRHVTAKHATRCQLGTLIPSFLIFRKLGQQLIHLLDGRLLARLTVSRTRLQPSLQQIRLNQQALTGVGLIPQGPGLFKGGVLVLVCWAPFFAGSTQK